jgi:cardiolipin synthase
LSIRRPTAKAQRVDTEFQVEDNRFSLLTLGRERLEALVALIDAADRSLRLLYYIFANDSAGKRVRDALIAAAGRGVSVRVIIDGLGSNTTGDDAFFKPLRGAGVELCVFVPHWGRRYLMRNHQKMALADDARAIIGGFNVADGYFADADGTRRGEDAWRDLGLTIEGPAARQLAGYFDALADWTRQPHARMRDLRRALQQWSNPSGRVRWLHGGPARRVSPWLKRLRADLQKARDVSLVAAYFAPTVGLTRLIDKVAQRGRARVMTAAKTDNLATIGAARFTFPGLLRKGTQVFEYEPSRLHTKLYVIDDIVHIGSANFDPRSLFLNLEIMLRVEDSKFAGALRSYIDGEIEQSRERRLAEFQGVTSIPDRMRNALCYFLVAVLDPNVTRRINLGVE